jgi:hypothetical protein
MVEPLSGVDPYGERAYAIRRGAVALEILGFLKEIGAEHKGDLVEFDKEEVLLYMDAFRSREFMLAIERDPDLPVAIKAQIAVWNSGLNKIWPAVKNYVRAPDVGEIGGFIFGMFQLLDRVMVKFHVEIIQTIPSPLELPPGGDGASTDP